MNPYAEEKLSLAAHELKGSPNRKKLQHVLLRTLVAVSENDFPSHLRPRFEEIRSIVFQHGKLSSDTVSRMSDEEVREVWNGLRELSRDAG